MTVTAVTVSARTILNRTGLAQQRLCAREEATFDLDWKGVVFLHVDDEATI